MAELSDEVLLKKASLPGRDILGLALLATVVGVLACAVALFGKDLPDLLVFLPWSIALIAASYWFLGVAARRGDRNAVAVAAVIFTIQVAVAFVSMVIAQGQNQMSGAGGAKFIIPAAVIALLVRDYKILTQLKKRGLWETAFPVRKPTTALCTVGGVLLMAGIVVLNLGTFQARAMIEEDTKVLKEGVEKFVGIVKKQEAALMNTMKRLSNPEDTSAYDDTIRDLEALHKRVEVVREELKDVGQLNSILFTYAAAVEHWRKGMELLLSDNPKAQTHLKKGIPCARTPWTSSTSASSSQRSHAAEDRGPVPSPAATAIARGRPEGGRRVSARSRRRPAAASLPARTICLGSSRMDRLCSGRGGRVNSARGRAGRRTRRRRDGRPARTAADRE